jgi:hypothetical protein
MPRLAVALLTFVLLATPLAAEAQQAATKVYRIAYLVPGSPLSTLTGREPSHPMFRAFFRSCASSGMSRGRTW